MSARRVRLAVALVVRGDAGTEIDGLRRALGARALERIPPHLTLVPPVNVREEHLDEAVAALRSAAASSMPLRLELGPVATFYPPVPVLYLAVSGDVVGLSALRDRLRAGPFSRRDEREFVPHVTLDQHLDPAQIPAAVELLGSYHAPVVFGRVSLLLHDDLSKRWLVAAEAMLEAPAIIGRGGLEIELSNGPVLDPAAERFFEEEWAAYSLETYGPMALVEEPYAVTARIGDEIVGTATGTHLGSMSHLSRLVVSKPWRSHGVGAHLVRAVEQLAIVRGAERVRVEVRGGSRAVGFYEELGYAVTARLPRWRVDREFVVMEHKFLD